MSRMPLDPRSKLLQLFLTANPPSVCEVGAEDTGEKTARIRCTCQAWTWENPCAHHLLVVGRMRENEGSIYPVEVIGKVLAEDIELAAQSMQSYREFILTRTKIEVLDS